MSAPPNLFDPAAIGAVLTLGILIGGFFAVTAVGVLILNAVEAWQDHRRVYGSTK